MSDTPTVWLWEAGRFVPAVSVYAYDQARARVMVQTATFPAVVDLDRMLVCPPGTDPNTVKEQS